ncbi:MAG: ABC transporter substrate-binding protein [Rhodospirillaceae bacterium]|nr:ABC transporter substrate-binding protein [Rhodospirillaceae bacterium]
MNVWTAARVVGLSAALMAAVPALAQSFKPLTIATGAMPAGRLNPHDTISITRAWLYAAVYDALTYVDRDGKLTGWLATSWDNPSPTEWVFHLRRDVYFSNGKPFSADDVVNTIAYLTGPEGNTEAVAPFAANISKAVALDSFTVQITTQNPDPVLPQRLSLVRIAAMPDGLAYARANLVKASLGTGPYMVKDWAANKATLVATSKPWRRAPTPVLHAISLPDAAARKNALIAGMADIASAAFDFAELQTQDNANLVLEEDQIPAVVGLAFNTTKETPFRDIRVRQAIISAVNTRAIVDALFAGRAALAHQPARHEFLGYNPAVAAPAYDPDKAKCLLAEAGYRQGFRFSLALTGGGTIWGQVFQMVASELARVNVIMEIELVPEPTMSAMIYNTGVKTDAMGAIYFSPSFDGLDAVRQHTCAWPTAWFCDPDVDKLRDAALASADVETRANLTRKLMARTQENAQALFLYESVNLVAYNKRIKNFRADFGFLRYELMDVQ